VLRALADILGLPGFGFDSSLEVLGRALDLPPGATVAAVDTGRLSNANATGDADRLACTEPCVASIYQLDGLVRRAASLQQTADARVTGQTEVAA